MLVQFLKAAVVIMLGVLFAYLYGFIEHGEEDRVATHPDFSPVVRLTGL